MKEKNEFLDTIVNFAVVLRADIKTITELKLYLARNQCINVIYQKYSFQRLLIQEDGEEDEAIRK